MTAKPIRLPADGQAHRTAIEWWYFNGHLAEDARERSGARMRSARGPKHYAFMSSFFRADTGKALIPSLKNPFLKSKAPYAYFAHAVVSDLARRKTFKAIEPICVVSSQSFARPLLFIDYINLLGFAHGYKNGEIAETAAGVFRVKNELFDLELTARKKPLLQGGKGYISVCGKHSYYYSYTDLAARGLVKAGGDWVGVTGTAWMDHQWANVAWSKDRWTWFSLRLDNGTEIMCVEYDSGKKKDCVVGIMDADGRAEYYKAMRLAPLGKDFWESAETGARYPMSWHIEIPEKKAVFNVKALLRDQEMVSGALHYWEGPIAVRGKMNGKRANGKGFMELVGYPGRRGAGHGMRDALWKKIGFRLP